MGGGGANRLFCRHRAIVETRQIVWRGAGEGTEEHLGNAHFSPVGYSTVI